MTSLVFPKRHETLVKHGVINSAKIPKNITIKTHWALFRFATVQALPSNGDYVKQLIKNVQTCKKIDYNLQIDNLMLPIQL